MTDAMRDLAVRGLRPALMVGALVLILLVLQALSPVFFEPRNLINVLVQASMLSILALGMTVVMVGGGIDLSLPANMALSAILGSMAMIAADSVLLGCLVMLACGAAIGAFNGFAVARLRMIPFVVTLAMMTVAVALVAYGISRRTWDAPLLGLGLLPLLVTMIFGISAASA